MAGPRRSRTSAPDLGHTYEVKLDGHRTTLTPGTEVSVIFPTRKTATRARFLRAERNGDLTFVDRHNKLRTVTSDKVVTVHWKPKLRENA